LAFFRQRAFGQLEGNHQAVAEPLRRIMVLDAHDFAVLAPETIEYDAADLFIRMIYRLFAAPGASLRGSPDLSSKECISKRQPRCADV
jgi:hypothetical protein